MGIFGNANGMFGKKHSAETIEKIKTKALGRKTSEETKAKMRESAKHRVISEDNMLKMHTSMLGRIHTPETIAKLRLQKQKAWQNPAYVEKMHNAGFGQAKKS